MSNSRDIELLYEIGSLRHMQRTWRSLLGVNVANDLDHTIRVIWIALILARRAKKGDEGMIIKMALVHDIGETRTGDHNYIQRVYNDSHEDKAVNDTLTGTVMADFEQIHKAYEKRDSIEAKIVKDADNLDVDIELQELKQQGHELAAKWIWMRRHVRDEKLYTEEAKQLWDELQNSDPSSWHQEGNKFKKIPDAGR